MTNKIKMITFDLDDTLWDNKPTITNAEIKTREWIEDRVGAIEWGDLNDFLQIREALIRKDKSIIEKYTVFYAFTKTDDGWKMYAISDVILD